MSRTLFAAGRIPARKTTSRRVAAIRLNTERVRVLFGDGIGAPTLGLEMDRATYNAIPLRDPATPEMFRAIAARERHGDVLVCRPDFDDLYVNA